MAQQQGTPQTNGALAPVSIDSERYANFTRFELELEFVQLLGNPVYLQHLAEKKYYDDPAFVQYLAYLEYFRLPRYVKYLQWPGPTLKALELLQQEQFRRDILSPQVVAALQNEWFNAAAAGAGG